MRLILIILIILQSCRADSQTFFALRAPNVRLLVEDFGAIADGTTDNTEAINDAIQTARSGDTVYFDVGTYLIKNSFLTADVYQPQGVILKTGVLLLGADSGTSIIKAAPPPVGAHYTVATRTSDNAEFYPVVWGTNTHNVKIQNLKVDGDNANQINWSDDPFQAPYVLGNGGGGLAHYGVCSSGIHFYGGHDNELNTVSVVNAAAAGVMVESCPNTEVLNSFFENCAFGGIGSYFSADVHIQGVKVYNNYCDAVRFGQDSDNIIIEDSEIAYAIPYVVPGGFDFAGVYGERSNNAIIRNNHLHHNASYGIDCYAPNPYTGVSVTGNLIEYNYYGGVNVAQKGYTIYDNEINLNPPTYARLLKGINIHNEISDPSLTGADIIISNNTFSNHTYADTFIWAVAGITGLTITGNTRTGVADFYNGNISSGTSTITGNSPDNLP